MSTKKGGIAVRGTLRAICVAHGSRAEPEVPSEVQLVAGSGIVGDRYFGHKPFSPEEELTLVAAEEIDAFNRRTGLGVSYCALRRNLVTVGVELNTLVGLRFKVGSVEVEGLELCEPCAVLGRLLAVSGVEPRDVIRELHHRGGLRARIVTSGTVRVGDEIRLSSGGQGR